MPEPEGKAGPIASTGGSHGPGLQPKEHFDACAQCISGMLLPCAVSSSVCVWGGGVKNVAVHRVTGVLVAFGEKLKVADGREMSMDRVAKPTHWGPLTAMRQWILGSHTPPCHRRMVITT